MDNPTSDDDNGSDEKELQDVESQQPSTSTSRKRRRTSSDEPSRESSPSEDKKPVRVIPARPVVHDGYHVDLRNLPTEKRNLYEVAKKELSGNQHGGCRLPTTREEYFDLEETLMNPSRMEGKELTLNAYDTVRATYSVLPGKTVSEADMQKVIGSLSCDVCQELIHQSIITKNCGHRFCDQCIMIVLTKSSTKTCPTCRQNLGSKRDFQQDPRCDELIQQFIPSRSIIPRMMAKNREHEKDIYFGRKGYTEGGEVDDHLIYKGAGKKRKKPKRVKRKKNPILWTHSMKKKNGSTPKLRKNTTRCRIPGQRVKKFMKTRRLTRPVVIVNDGEAIQMIPVADPAVGGDAVAKDALPVDLPRLVRVDYSSDDLRSDASVDDRLSDAEKKASSRCESPSHSGADRKTEKRSKKRKRSTKKSKKRLEAKHASGTEDSDDSSESSGDEGKKDGGKEKSKQGKKKSGRPKKKSKYEDLGVDINAADIPTPSEDSLTSTDEETEEKDPYDFVFEEEFNRDPRKDGHPDKDKLYNFDFMLQMNTQITRKYEDEGVAKVISDDSNDDGSSGTDEEPCDFHNEKFEKEVSEFMNKVTDKTPGAVEKGLIIPPQQDVIVGYASFNNDAEISMESVPAVSDHEDETGVAVVNEEALKSASSVEGIVIDGFVHRENDPNPPTIERIPEMIEEIVESKPEKVYVVHPEYFIFPPKAESPKKVAGFRNVFHVDDQSEPEETESENKKRHPSIEYRMHYDYLEDDVFLKSGEEDDGFESDEEEDWRQPWRYPNGRYYGYRPRRNGSWCLHENNDAARDEGDRPRRNGSWCLRENNDAAREEGDRPRRNGSWCLENNDAAREEGDRPRRNGSWCLLENNDAARDNQESPRQHEAPAKPEDQVSFLDETYSPTRHCPWTPIENNDIALDEVDRPIRDESWPLQVPDCGSVSNQVFYDTVRVGMPYQVTREDERLAESMELEYVEAMTRKQVAYEESKIHQRRLAATEAMDDVAEAIDVDIESSEDEEEAPPPTRRSAPLPATARTSSPVEPCPVLTSEVGETPIEEIFFDESAPCSSAQAERRDQILQRVCEEQEAIEQIIEKERNTPPTGESSSSGTFKKPETPKAPSDAVPIESENLNLIDAHNAPLVETDAESAGTPATAATQENVPDDVEDEDSDLEVIVNPKTKTVKVTLSVTMTVPEDMQIDEENADHFLGQFMSKPDAEILRPNIYDYVSDEFLRLVEQQLPIADEALALDFCARNTENEFETLCNTGKRVTRNPDDQKLESLVKQFHQRFKEKYPRNPTTRPPQNMERRLIERAHVNKYKHCVDANPLHLKVLRALQKQQVANWRSHDDNPPAIDPVESAEQASLLQNLHNPVLFRQLAMNPQFAITLQQVQQQSGQVQRARQRADERKSLAARKAEQARVEELARKRIAQENAAEQAVEESMASNPQPAEDLPEGSANNLEQPPPPANLEAKPSLITPKPEEWPSQLLPSLPLATSSPIKPARPSSAFTHRPSRIAEQTRGRSEQPARRRLGQANSRSRSPIDRNEPIETARYDTDDSDSGGLEPILAGNITHIVDTTILEEIDLKEEQLSPPSTPGRNNEEELEDEEDEDEDYDGEDEGDGGDGGTMAVENPEAESAVTQIVEKTVELEFDESYGDKCDQFELDAEEYRKAEENRERLEYTQKYQSNALSAALKAAREKYKVSENYADDSTEPMETAEKAEDEPQGDDMVAPKEETVEENANAEETEQPENHEEQIVKVDQFAVAERIMKQLRGFDTSEESEPDELDNYASLVKPVKAPYKKREPRERQQLFVPKIPLHIRKKYKEMKIEKERATYRQKVRAHKMANIRISVPPRPPPAPPQFVAPLPPNRGPKGPRATPQPKPKKPKMSNVNTPTKITAVPNVAAGYQQQPHPSQHQQRVMSDMAQVPQSTPIRPMPTTGAAPQHPTPVASLNAAQLAQLGQLVPLQSVPSGQPMNAAQAQAAHARAMQAAQLVHELNQNPALKQAVQQAQLQQQATAVQQAQLQQQATAAQPNPVPPRQGVPQGVGQQVNPMMAAQQQIVAQQMQAQQQRQMNPQQVEAGKRQQEEAQMVYQVLYSRGQYPPQSQELFQAHYAQALHDVRFAAAQRQAQAAQAMKAQQEAARQQQLMKEKEQARLRAEAEARAKAEAEARAKEERRRAAEQHAHFQAQAQAHAQAQLAMQKMSQQMQQYQMMQNQQQMQQAYGSMMPPGAAPMPGMFPVGQGYPPTMPMMPGMHMQPPQAPAAGQATVNQLLEQQRQLQMQYLQQQQMLQQQLQTSQGATQQWIMQQQHQQFDPLDAYLRMVQGAPQAAPQPAMPMAPQVVQQAPQLIPQVVPQAVPQVAPQMAPQASAIVQNPVSAPPQVHSPAPILQPIQPLPHEVSDVVKAEVANEKVEFECWPTNGYALKKNMQQVEPLFSRTDADSTLYHVAALINRSSSEANDLGSFWAYRLEDQELQQFQPNQVLADVKRFVGNQQHLIFFYDDVLSGETPKTKEYVINNKFSSRR